MNIVKITEKNILDIGDPIPHEFANEISRVFINGNAGIDDDGETLKAVVFWEVKDLEDESVPTKIQILWFYAKDCASGVEILKTIEESPEYDGVSRVFFELQKVKSVEQAALNEAGYTTSTGESSDILVTVEEVSNVKALKGRVETYVKSISDVTAHQFKAGIMNCSFHGRYGLLDDLPFLPITRFDPDISCCVLTDDKVDGFMLVHKIENGSFRVELFAAMQPDAQIHLLNMMRFSAKTIKSKRSSDDTVLLSRHNKASAQLIEKLFPEKKGAQVLKGEK